MSTGSTAQSSSKSAPSSGNKGKAPKRVSREAQGLPPLTREQTMMRSLVQQAQNACSFLKKQIDSGTVPSKSVLQACGTLAATLGASLGSE